MSNLPISGDLKEIFQNVTNGTGEGADTRAILVANDNGQLRLIESLPAEGSDKDDFGPILGKLFSAEPTRPGYALYRLDSKSPAGLWEWLNCAYRPDGAKIREKMQYTLTQTSLMAGLSEQHFLETIYGGTAQDFAFPQKLRNARKHDYQNPQVAVKGRSAAEAAGGGIGGARRTFDARGAADSSAKEQKAVSETTTTATTAPTTQLSTSPTNDTEAATANVGATAARSSAPDTGRTAEPTETAETSEPSRPDFPSSMTEDGTQKETTTVDQVAVPESTTSTTEETVEPVKTLPQEESVLHQVDASSRKPGALAELAKTTDSITQTPDDEDDASASIAPSSQPGLTVPAAATEQPAEVVSSASRNDAAAVATTASESARQDDKSGGPSATANASISTPSTSSIGTGRGVQGLETERERDLTQLKVQEDAARSSGSGASGGPRAGLAWDGDVEPALRGLGKKGIMGSTAEWNLVLLRLDLSKELVQLAVPPRIAMPGDIAAALEEATTSTEGGTEPCYAFYTHPQAQKQESTSTSVVLIYVCPMHSTVRQRMIYSSNLVSLVSHASTFDGLEIAKRLETSDADELTPEYLVGAIDPNQNAANEANATTYTRPKRPGRK